MKKIFFVILIIMLLVIPIVSYADIELTEEEREWLEEHPIIKFAGDPDWAPIDYFDGEQKGLAVDYLDVIEEMLDIQIQYVHLDSWTTVVEAIENKEVDMILGSYHASREDTMTFSNKIIDVPYIFVTRNDYSEKIDVSELHTKRVATVEGWVLNTVLQELHPGIETVAYPTVADALKAVSFGTEDLFIQELASVSYAVEEHKITNLKYAKEYPRSVDVRFILRKDYEMLRIIIDKTLLEIPDKEKKDIYNKWISLSITPFYKEPLYIIVITLILLASLLSMIWFKILHRQIQTKTQALQNELEQRADIQLQLEEAIEQQKDIQREMIQQERMASLGSMVAGISHEVNNPLGVCLTTASAFKMKLEKLRYAYEHDNLKKNQFIEFIELSDDTARLVEDNLQRAIETINSFKNMAINQMQDGKEMIEICGFIEGIKSTLKYELKKKKVEVDIVCAENIFILGDVGALTQVFTNLILNSLIHGFVNEQSSYKIQIKSAIIERVLVVEYRDNGIGIPLEIIDSIFKLFFTTKRDQGGSGIGLHIVRNLLKEKFDGSIACSNHAESGVIFTLRLPMKNH
jgi:signal transduction histidine kinase